MRDEAMEELPLGQAFEAAPGVIVERRSLFALAGLALGAGLSPRTPLRRAQASAQAGELELAAFLQEACAQALDLVGDTSRIGQERYLHALASWAACLRRVPVPEQNETTNKESPARTWIGVNEGGDPFTVLHWRMEPGARILPHPHIYGNVVTLALEGEVRIQNHEMVGPSDFDTKESFVVRRTCDQVLLPGDLNLVSLEHGYVHGFTAGPEGARGLDLTTRIRERRPTPNLVLEGEPVDEARALFRGRWRYP